jgi:hypothetical protein
VRTAAAALLVALLAAAGARAEEPTPVLVELYTSQGCSSCPPADALLKDLVQRQPVAGARIVPLSLHVDYWNRLGWRDPWSDEVFGARQMLYADAEGRRYTPQMVVDGSRQFLGSSRSKAREAIAEAGRRPKARLALGADQLGGGRLRVAVSGEGIAPGQGEVLVHLALTRSRTENEVRRGENAGRKLEHVAVVRELRTLGSVRGGRFAGETSLGLDGRGGGRHLVAFAQESGGRRRVLAIGILDLSPMEKPAR